MNPLSVPMGRAINERGRKAFLMGILLVVVLGMDTRVRGESPEGETKMRFAVRIDRGQDLGQNFGSLFEVQTADGAAVLGGGFQGLYNTYHRADRHVAHFFIRPTDGERSLSIERLPRPTEIAGTYLFDLDGTIYSSSEDVRSWDESAGAWKPDPSDARGRMRLGTGMLTFDGKRVEYNGRSILPGPERGEYQRFYYAQGRLFFYHTYWADQSGYRLHAKDDEGFSKLYACPWTPDEDGGVDLARATVITLPVVGEVPFSFGQLGREVLTCSNIGGVYVFGGEAWRTAVEAEIDTSYQVYSMINFYDRLLLGQYPTGLLFEYSGDQVTPIEGWPPKMPGVSSSVREAQTTAIYGGDLFVGVVPWAELWRYNPDTDGWTFVSRMFTHPPITDETDHPYEDECMALGIVYNQWGQRVTSLVPLGSSLILSTCAKSPTEWKPEYDFVGDGKWKEYGAVIRLTMPGSLCATTSWTDGP
ncbi:MAG: hypothetical protein QGI83_24855, partial [Candidatus Latescibacteria bacterium]|nr:hypothetical protein [Candidatus Latescibacterota bacterium]